MDTAINLPIELDEQASSLLCWAAVTLALGKYYQPGFQVSQVELARGVFGNPHYNRVLHPRKALELTGTFKQALPRPLSLLEIVDELQQGYPIAACMRYFIGWHLVIVHGLTPCGELLVADSLHGPSVYDLASFSHAYHKHYTWSHSYLTRSPTQLPGFL